MDDDGLKVTYEQLRSIVVETLRKGSVDQIGYLKRAIPPVAKQMGLVQEPSQPQGGAYGRQPVYMGGGRHEDMLTDRDFGRVQSVMWDLIIEGIVRPGLRDGMNDALPFFHITEWGQQVLTENPPIPYDPDGYLKRLHDDVLGLDAVIVTYLSESLHTFRINCLLSSTIALGCAAEKALLLLIDAYGASLPDKRRAEFEKDTKGRMIKRQFDEFQKMLNGELRKRLPPDLEDGLDIELTALFDFIRNQRNDAGHPTGKTVERERAYANLVVFPVYLRKVYELIDWVTANPKA